MIGRRKSPDGMPFRLYERVGKFKVSYGYKLPDGTWEFRLTAPANKPEEVARIKQEAIARANVLNGEAPKDGTVAALVSSYFEWQYSLPKDSEDRKAKSTLEENEREKLKLLPVFGQVKPSRIKAQHVYQYLDGRAKQGAPSKANKEIALLSAILEYGRRLGHLEENPCRDIKYNKTKPKDKVVLAEDLEYAVQEARRRGGSYLVLALTAQAAYMMICRPTEIRELTRQSIQDAGVRVPIAKRKKGQAQRYKLIEWTDELRAVLAEALALQKTASIYVFGNQSGQVYTRSGWNKIWGRLMGYCERRAVAEGVEFVRFTLADMRPTAVTTRMEAGDEATARGDATGNSPKMVQTVYDRRRTRKAKATPLKG